MNIINSYNAWQYRLSSMANKLNSREKLLIPFTLLLLFTGACQGTLHLLNLQGWKTVEANSVRVQTEIQMTDKAIETILAAQNDPKIVRLQNQIVQLKPQAGLLDEKIIQTADFLIPPKQMPVMLEQLLANYPGLKLSSLKTLDPIIVKSPTSEAQLYRHGLVLKLSGSYKSISFWLRDIEKLSWVLNWDHLKIEMEKWPKGELELEIHTLSREKGAIGV